MAVRARQIDPRRRTLIPYLTGLTAPLPRKNSVTIAWAWSTMRLGRSAPGKLIYRPDISAMKSGCSRSTFKSGSCLNQPSSA